MKKVKLFYYYSKKNFGDQLNLLITDEVFNKKVELAHPSHAEISMIGSILEPFILNKPSFMTTLKKYIYPPVNIYGSGFITEPKRPNEKYIRKINVSAVRGTRTRDRLSKNLNKNLSNICLGDPGLLASRTLFEKEAKKYSVGIIPHMINMSDPRISELNNFIENSIVINPLDDVKKVISQISQCDVIVSNAMHGLIVADSLGVPNKRLVLKNELIGGNYKFFDYYSAFGIDLQSYIDMDKSSILEIGQEINNIKNTYNISYDQVQEIQQKLIDNAPPILKSI